MALRWLFSLPCDTLRGEGAAVMGVPVAGAQQQQPTPFYAAVRKWLPVDEAAASPLGSNAGSFTRGVGAAKQQAFTVTIEQVVAVDGAANAKSGAGDDPLVSLNLRIAVESPNSHVVVGVGPRGMQKHQPASVVPDEPGVLALSCSTDGATLWSAHAEQFGAVVAKKCLERSRGGDGYVARVGLRWNRREHKLAFLVAAGDGDAAAAATTVAWNAEKANVPGEEFDIADLAPFVAFSNEATQEQFSIE